MKTNPTVCAIMLTADRPEMAARAVRSFRAQTYANKRLLVVNSGPHPLIEETDDMWEPCFIGADALTIGELRNLGCKYASHHYAESWKRPEIFIHWDDDDVSHPQRISEQVEHLVSSGADAVGYSDLLFWKEQRPVSMEVRFSDAEAWLYSSVPNSCPGTSLCYWRRTWERKPFPDQPRPGFADGEDVSWVRYLNLKTVSSFGISAGTGAKERIDFEAPRLIASVHGRNTSGSYKRIGDPDNNFKRVPEWDDYCRVVMSMDRGEQFSGDPAREASGHQVDASGNRPSSQDE